MSTRPRPPAPSPCPIPPALTAADLAIARPLSDLFQMHGECARPPCARAGACRARNAPCIAEYRDTFRALLIDLLDYWEPLRETGPAPGEDEDEDYLED